MCLCIAREQLAKAKNKDFIYQSIPVFKCGDCIIIFSGIKSFLGRSKNTHLILPEVQCPCHFLWAQLDVTFLL